MNSNSTKKTAPSNSNKEEIKGGYTMEEDLAILNFMTTEKRYLLASGVRVWKEAEQFQICPGRPYLSMKERYRKVIVKNLRHYNIDKQMAIKIIQFTRASREGKSFIRLREK